MRHLFSKLPGVFQACPLWFKSSSALLSLRAMTVASSVIGTAVCAQTIHRAKPGKPPASTPKKATMTPPETPQELWSRILMLMNKHGGYVSKSGVEEAMGLKFTKSEKESDDPNRKLSADYLHSVRQEVPNLGRFLIVLFERPKRSDLVVHWGPETSVLPDCLQWNTAVQDLGKRGWKGFKTPAGVLPGGGSFGRVDELADPRWVAGGTNANRNAGMSSINFHSPNQYSTCLNAMYADIWAPTSTR